MATKNMSPVTSGATVGTATLLGVEMITTWWLLKSNAPEFISDSKSTSKSSEFLLDISWSDMA